MRLRLLAALFLALAPPATRAAKFAGQPEIQAEPHPRRAGETVKH